MSHRELVVTTGDPQGIGPEVSVGGVRRFLADVRDARCLLLGDRRRLDRLAPELPWVAPAGDADAPGMFGLDVPDPEPVCGRGPSAAGGEAALAVLEAGLARVRARPGTRALVTAPVSKEAIARADRPFTGHTGWLAEQLGAPHPVMLFEGPGLRVALATVHVPLAEVPRRLSPEGLVSTLDVMRTDLGRRFGVARPRIAVLGLNPHAGEGGLLGDEERTVIAPALRAFRAGGGLAEGPFSADTFFRPANLERYDAILAMYHDQGLLPVKALGFGRAVNVTLGLPLIRTSVDHGCGFDIAGREPADCGSMVAALRLAWGLLERGDAAVPPAIGD